MLIAPQRLSDPCERVVAAMHRTPPVRRPMCAGMMRGMQVLTPLGPRAIEALAEGDRVIDAYGTMHHVRRLMRRRFMADIADAFPRGLIFAPRHALGTAEDTYFLPDQVLVQGGAGCRAAMLAGHRGIFRALPVDGVDFVRPIFDGPVALQVVHGPAMLMPDGNGDRGNTLVSHRASDVMGAQLGHRLVDALPHCELA